MRIGYSLKEYSFNAILSSKSLEDVVKTRDLDMTLALALQDDTLVVHVLTVFIQGFLVILAYRRYFLDGQLECCGFVQDVDQSRRWSWVISVYPCPSRLASRRPILDGLHGAPFERS